MKKNSRKTCNLKIPEECNQVLKTSNKHHTVHNFSIVYAQPFKKNNLNGSTHIIHT